MLRTAVGHLNRVFPSAGFVASRRWFEYLSSRESGEHLDFMNYGYHLPAPLDLLPKDQEHRYSIQLYHLVASAVDLRELALLEVGCGRGGGASYVCRYLRPRTLIALDLAASAIAYCREHYNTPGLSFRRGDAEALDFPDNSFDALLNVESSICYEHPQRFFAEAARVLKPGGHFLYADIRTRQELPAWNAQLAATGLEKLAEEDITAGVLAALELDNERRRRLIQQYVPRLLRPTFREFAGVRGSQFFYGAFASGEKVYKRFLFQKPNQGVRS